MPVQPNLDLLSRLAYLQAGGKDQGQSTLDKLNTTFGTIANTGKTLLDYAKEINAIDKAKLENQKLQQENTPLVNIVGGQTPAQTQSNVNQVMKQPIPAQDLISGRLDNTQQGLEDINRSVKQGQYIYDKYGTANVEQAGKIAATRFYEPKTALAEAQTIKALREPVEKINDSTQVIANGLASREFVKTLKPDLKDNEDMSKLEFMRRSAEAIGKIRGQSFGDIRQLPVIDTKTNTPMFMNANQLNDAHQIDPQRYAPVTPTTPAIAKKSLIEDIRGSIDNTRNAVNGLQNNFNQTMRLKLNKAVNSEDPAGAISNFISGEFGQSLTPDQQDYLVATQQLIEQAMAMRSVLGAGQGSEDLRRAIKNTIPSQGSFDKVYANKQLDAFSQTLDRLSRGVLNVKLTGDKDPIKNNINNRIEQSLTDALDAISKGADKNIILGRLKIKYPKNIEEINKRIR